MSTKCVKREGPYATEPANVATGAWRQKRPTVTDECTGCKICIPYCPTGVIEVEGKGKKAVIDYTYCKGCGICPTVCPFKALSMVPEELEGRDDG